MIEIEPVAEMKIGDIKPNPNNPRLIRDDKFESLKKSIDHFPQMMIARPIVVDEFNMVLGGNMRLRACADLNWKVLPVVKITGMTDLQKKEFIIKDNASFGEWDWEILANEWNDVDLSEWGIDIPKDSFTEEDEQEQSTDLQIVIKCDADQYAKIMNAMHIADSENKANAMSLIATYWMDSFTINDNRKP